MSASLRNTIAWILQVLLGLFLLFAGFNKLRDLSGTIHVFGTLGLPSALAYVVAGGELLGGIGLLVPRLTRLAATGLLLIMIGAVVMHVTKIPGGLTGGVPALVCLILLALLLWLRSPFSAKAV
ncbi:DoxX family protein [Fibrella sp. USSR17]